MPSDQLNNQYQANDEIDLKDLILALWEGKWMVIGCVILAMASAFAYLILVPQTYKGTLAVKSIDSFEAATYAPLNSTGLLEITPRSLAAQFFDELFSGPVLSKYLAEVGYLSKDAAESELNYQQRLQRVLGSFTFIPPKQEGDKSGVSYWKITYQGKQLELAKEALTMAMEEVEGKVESHLQQQFQFQLQTKQNTINNAITNNLVVIDSLKLSYKRELAAEIALVQEQALIARQLNIADNQLLSVVQTYSNNPGVISLTDEKPNYLQGYKGLEVRLKQLKARNLDLVYGQDLASAEKAQYMLKHDQSVIEAKQAYAKTALATHNFTAVRYNINALDVTPKVSSILIIALSIVLGGMLGLFVLIVRNAIRK